MKRIALFFSLVLPATTGVLLASPAASAGGFDGFTSTTTDAAGHEVTTAVPTTALAPAVQRGILNGVPHVATVVPLSANSAASPSTSGTLVGNTCYYSSPDFIASDVGPLGDSQHYGQDTTPQPYTNYLGNGDAHSQDDGTGENHGASHADLYMTSFGVTDAEGSGPPPNYTVTVTYPWSLFGDLLTQSNAFPLPATFLSPSTAQADYALETNIGVNSISGSVARSGDSLSNHSGQPQSHVEVDSWSKHGSSAPTMTTPTLTANSGDEISSVLEMNMDASDDTNYLASATSDVFFDDSGGSTYNFGLTSAQWTFNLPSGWVMVSCG